MAYLKLPLMRKSDTQFVGTDNRDHMVKCSQHKSLHGSHGTTIFISSLITGRLYELVEQVAMSSVQLNVVEKPATAFSQLDHIA